MLQHAAFKLGTQVRTIGGAAHRRFETKRLDRHKQKTLSCRGEGFSMAPSSPRYRYVPR